MVCGRYLLMYFFLVVSTTILFGQSRQDLTAKRQRLIAEIGQANKLLSITKKDKKNALSQYYALQRQIRQRQQLIETLEKEIALSDKSIERTQGAIEALQSDMFRLEKEYGEMARQAYRYKMSNNKWLFLFSSEDFSDGLKRWRYIQQYDDYRKKQAGLILETRTSLTEKLNGIEIKKAEQQDLLATAEKQQGLLESELTQKNKLVSGLKADETRISRLITRKRVAHRKLSVAIEKIISAEISNRTTATKSTKASKNTTKAKKLSSAESKKIAASSSDFRRRKGKLAWPVQNGIITRHFGKQSHPIHKQVQITNNGIDIRATSNNKVLAIYKGQVAGFQYVPGYQNTLIIQHGNYYSVYSNLEQVIVKKGETVRSGQLLGVASKSNQDDFLEVHLEIWKGKQRLNPAVWLKR
ncbi:MAG: peptidoglycan DD-metalloendopeptidase family protein [Bacteroidota bacterium]